MSPDRAVLLDVSETWTPLDRAENQCAAVAFDVPRDLAALRVELAYDRADGAVLDLGCEGPRGYVGWSGAARSSYVVSPQWSTPGYLPTEVTAGRWNVLVGLHRIPPAGVPCRLRVSAASDAAVAAERDRQPPAPPVPERGPRRYLPALDGMRWLAADFHAHTLHSDGSLSVEELAALAVSRGLDALAVTDHNTTSHHAVLSTVGERYGIRLLPGQEVTTDRGHANAVGDIGFVDFRRPGAQWQRDVAARGGLLSVNHPLGGDCCWRMALDRPTSVAEVWHSSWKALPLLHDWGGPLAWWLAWDRTTTPIGGSDFHRHGDPLPGTPTTWVLTEGDDVLGGVRTGRTAVAADPAGPVLLRLGDDLVVVGGEGLLLTGFDAGRRLVGSDAETFTGASGGPWWLEDEQTRVLALCG